MDAWDPSWYSKFSIVNSTTESEYHVLCLQLGAMANVETDARDLTRLQESAEASEAAFANDEPDDWWVPANDDRRTRAGAPCSAWRLAHTRCCLLWEPLTTFHWPTAARQSMSGFQVLCLLG